MIEIIRKQDCVGCGACSQKCPVNCISLSVDEQGFLYPAVYKEKCIGCGLCVRNCPSDAITLEDNLAHIDQEKCTHCGICKEKCPVKIIL